MTVELIAVAAIVGILGVVAGHSIARASANTDKARLEGQVESLTLQLQGRASAETLNASMTQTIEQLTKELNQLRVDARDNATKRAELDGKLTQQLQTVIAGTSTLTEQTGTITRVLTNSQSRGRWGESELEKLLQSAGLQRGVHYDIQVSLEGGKPDVVVNLSNGQHLAIDSKAPFANYWASEQTDDPNEQTRLLAAFAADVKKHAIALNARDYANKMQGPAFVMLFLPAESMLYAAIKSNPQLINECAEKNVYIASPLTLLSMLQAVNLGWQHRELEERTHEFAATAGKLLQALAGLTDLINKVGSGLNSAVNGYNDMIKRFDNSVVNNANRLKNAATGFTGELESPKPVKESPNDFQGKIASLAETEILDGEVADADEH